MQRAGHAGANDGDGYADIQVLEQSGAVPEPHLCTMDFPCFIKETNQ